VVKNVRKIKKTVKNANRTICNCGLCDGRLRQATPAAAAAKAAAAMRP